MRMGSGGYGDMQKLQSTTEFLSVYVVVLIIISLVFVFLFFSSPPQRIIPTMCTFTYGVQCDNIVFGQSNSLPSVLLILSSSQSYPVANPYVFVNYTGERIKGTCEPDFVLPGGSMLCNVTLSGQASGQSSLAGSLYLVDSVCPNGNAMTCTNSPKQVYRGTFSSYQTAFSANQPVISLSIATYPLPQTNSSRVIQLVSNAKLKGRNVIGATVSMSANSIAATLVPIDANTDANGDATYDVVVGGSFSGSISVTASLATVSNTITLDFASGA